MPLSPDDLNEIARQIRTGKAADALPRLSELVDLGKNFGAVDSLRIEALINLGRTGDASAALEAAMGRVGADADACDALAFFARQLGKHDLSNSLYRQATELRPSDPQLWYNLATSDRSLGRLSNAAHACERALHLQPEFRPAILLRSELTRATNSRNHVTDLQHRLARTQREIDAMFLSYALGKELHELGHYDEAFHAFCRGAAIRRRNMRYDVSSDEKKLAAIASAFDEQGTEAPTSGKQHIFIVGLPRSGTTLTERILGGLPDVRSNNETDNFSAALMLHSANGNGTVFERSARANFAAVAKEYDTLAGSTTYGGHIIEKLPLNYLYVGAILRTFADASVVWVRRNPVDSCFAMFRTLFGSAYPFSYDFDDLARYFAAYDKLMKHWTQLFPERITCVDYEDLVTDTAAVARRLADQCGLTWREEAIDITSNTSASLTASASQVREGVYNSSVESWRKYEEHLQLLIRELAIRGIISDQP